VALLFVTWKAAMVLVLAKCEIKGIAGLKIKSLMMDNLSETSIIFLLLNNDRAVERGILALYKKQTSFEKSNNITNHYNEIVFSKSDANLGSYLAKWILGGNHLTDKWLSVARHLTMKYRKQLLQIALEKAKFEKNIDNEERIAIQQFSGSM